MAGKRHVVCCSHGVGMMTDQEKMSQEDTGELRIAKTILNGVDILN